MRTPPPRTFRFPVSLALGALVGLLSACGAVPTGPESPDPTAPEVREVTVLTPWSASEVTLAYEVVDGLAVYEGDIVLGEVNEDGSLLAPQSIARNRLRYRWPDGVVPFEIAAGVPAAGRANVQAAVAHWNDYTHLTFVARSGQEDYLEFVVGSDASACSSSVGRTGGRQRVFLTSAGTCAFGTLVHELGHAVGLWHEQSRSDRDDFVEILRSNIQSGRRHNFNKRNARGFDLGGYDYCSIMHYRATAFGRPDAAGNAMTTIRPLQTVDPETLPDGSTCSAIGNRQSLSDGDLASLRLLYPGGPTLWYEAQDGVQGQSEADDFYGAALASGDFDGDGFPDLAVGIAREDVGTIANAGAVNVLYGSSAGLTATGDQLLHQDAELGPGSVEVAGAAEADDLFGSALATGDFDRDGFDDLAVGVPGEAIGAVAAAGAVHVFYGSPLGLLANELWHQNRSGVEGVAEAADLFGSAVAAGDFDGDGTDDLAVGVPAEDIGDVRDAGLVHLLFGRDGDALTADGSRALHAGDLGLADLPLAAFQRLGSALAAGDFDGDGTDDLAVGVPTLGGGAVVVLAAGGPQADVWSQDTAGVEGVAENGDLFGASLAAGDFDGDGTDDLAVGVPGEAIGTTPGAGAVGVLFGGAAGLSAAGDLLLHQGVVGVEGAVEANDAFGSSVAWGDLDGDGSLDLAVGIPREDVGDLADAGAAQAFFGDGAGGTARNRLYYQAVPGIAGAAEAYDLFGTSLVLADVDADGNDDLAIGVPRESVDGADSAGAVNLVVVP